MIFKILTLSALVVMIQITNANSAEYKFVGGCEKGEECPEGIYCGGNDNYAVCNHCSFNECNERAMKNQSYALAYKLRDDTKLKNKGWCRLCNDKEFSKFERGKDKGHKGWGLYINLVGCPSPK